MFDYAVFKASALDASVPKPSVLGSEVLDSSVPEPSVLGSEVLDSSVLDGIAIRDADLSRTSR